MKLIEDRNPPTESFNFGPHYKSNKTVIEMVKSAFNEWPGEFTLEENKKNLHEAKLLSLEIEKSYQILGWIPNWDFDKTVTKTIKWYRSNHEGVDARKLCLRDIDNYMEDFELVS